MQYYTKLIVCIVVLLPLVTYANFDEDNWIKSRLEDKDFATQRRDKSFETCRVAPSDDAVAHMYFKKFIGNLFSRKKMQYDEVGGIYQRTVVFSLQSAQLEKLEHLSDPRDLDTVLTEIFGNARTIVKLKNSGRGDYKIIADESGLIGSLVNIIKDVWQIFVDIIQFIWQIFTISEVQFLLWVAAAIITGWFVNRRYQIGIVKIILCSFLLFGYLYTYIECNRKLDVEEMLEVLDNEQPMNVKSYWFMPTWLFGSESTTPNRKANIKKATKIKLPFCRPDHVVIMYLNELFLKQLELLLDKCTSTFVSLRDTLSFPFNYIAGFAMVFLIAYIMKLTFKYILSPNAWSNLFHQSTNNTIPPHPQTSHAQALHASVEDRVSGENLKMLLNVLNSNLSLKQEQQSPMPSIHGSGVQELNALTEKMDMSDSSLPNKDENNDNNNSDSKTNHEQHNESIEAANVQEIEDNKTKEAKA